MDTGPAPDDARMAAGRREEPSMSALSVAEFEEPRGGVVVARDDEGVVRLDDELGAETRLQRAVAFHCDDRTSRPLADVDLAEAPAGERRSVRPHEVELHPGRQNRLAFDEMRGEHPSGDGL